MKGEQMTEEMCAIVRKMTPYEKLEAVGDMNELGKANLYHQLKSRFPYWDAEQLSYAVRHRFMKHGVDVRLRTFRMKGTKEVPVFEIYD